MATVILVNSPFQVICAAEFLAAGQQDFDLVFVRMGSAANLPQMEAVARRLGLPFRQLGGNGTFPVLGKWRRIRALRRLVVSLSSSDTLVIGNPGNVLLADALARARCENKWVLDEGVMTVRFLERISRGENHWRFVPDSWIGRTVTRLLLGGAVRAPRWDQVKWFTIFADYYPRFTAASRNTLELIRSRSRFSGPSQDVIFLGSSLVRGGVYEKDAYLSYCRQAAGFLRRRYPGCRLIYLRHRSEGPEEALAYGLFDDVLASSGPVELRWLDGGGEYPLAIGGILSTALVTLAELLPGATRIHMFKPPRQARVMRKFRDPASLFPVFDQATRLGKMTTEPLRAQHQDHLEDR